ncbi:MAG: hypothetical protein E7465_01150 [Ruminococcaceae bacterium]|nr:hypothetical protein [Oscillospiraceae bacterium]
MKNDGTSNEEDKPEDNIQGSQQYSDSLESDYRILVSPMHMCKQFIDNLLKHGYVASIYDSPSRFKPVEPYNTHQAIWLGSKIPVKVAIDVIRLAKAQYPHLKYIKLNDERRKLPIQVRYQLYIGGATSTAIENNIKPMSNTDFERLFSIEDIGKLHEFIKTFE